MVQIEFRLTQKEIYKGLVQNTNSRTITRITRLFGTVVLVVMVYITAVNIINGINYFSMSYLFPLVMGIYLTFISEITAKIQIPNLIKSKNPVTEHTRVRMDGNGFRMKGETFTNHIEWEKFHSIIESDDFFMMKTSEATANMLPKRAFTAEDMIEMKSLLTTVNGPKLKLRD